MRDCRASSFVVDRPNIRCRQSWCCGGCTSIP